MSRDGRIAKQSFRKGRCIMLLRDLQKPRCQHTDGENKARR